MDMKSLVITGVLFLIIAIGLTVGAGQLTNTIWHNAVLFLGGVFTGGVGILAALIMTRVPSKEEDAKHRG